ncbi:MAG: hypothetical protein M1338_00990, partial [Patescibacteria group bacterium]|nr:hypothetical protein [Patescibacteria group bacterium]
LDKKQAIIIPLLAMFISDIFIGFYNPTIMISVYLCFALCAFLGIYIGKNKNIFNIVGGSLLASIIFYLVTNYAVWAFSDIYLANFSGLAQSYIMAIPFFKSTLLGDLFYVSILFGGYELVKYFSQKYILATSKA